MTPIERTIFIIDAVSLLFIFFGRTLTDLVMYLMFMIFVYEKMLKEKAPEEKKKKSENKRSLRRGEKEKKRKEKRKGSKMINSNGNEGYIKIAKALKYLYFLCHGFLYIIIFKKRKLSNRVKKYLIMRVKTRDSGNEGYINLSVEKNKKVNKK